MIAFLRSLFGKQRKKSDEQSFGNSPPDPGVVMRVSKTDELMIFTATGYYVFRHDGTFAFITKKA